jgi:hypothetical protein
MTVRTVAGDQLGSLRVRHSSCAMDQSTLEWADGVKIYRIPSGEDQKRLNRCSARKAPAWLQHGPVLAKRQRPDASFPVCTGPVASCKFSYLNAYYSAETSGETFR